ncbi:MAG: exodeoxyribonuclease VII large subunit [Chitinispirillia bacterium]|jgi:exodeoxyribonuclease VII large subunit
MDNNFILLPPHTCEKPYTVSQLNNGIATIIESENTLVWVEGEISNFKRASSGHCYMRLKDSHSQIPAVMWRSIALKHTFDFEDGMAITAIASIRVYRTGGYYQLDIHKIQPSGIGAIFAAYEKLKKKLEAKGLFDTIYKKPIPESISTLGVITAKTGAAITDILKVVSKRAPKTNILLRSVPVQGEQAPSEIVTAINEMNEYGKVDCIIIGRGGGSIEDLWAFNTEDVVYAIFESKIPVISAVGHEIDVTLSDFVADYRAPTPSAAAEAAVHDERDNKRYFNELVNRFSFAVRNRFTSVLKKYSKIIHDPVFKKNISYISDSRQQLDTLRDRHIRAMVYLMNQKKTELAKYAGKLQALSPLSVLSRGYSVVTLKDGVPIKKAAELKIDNSVHIKFHVGDATADITSVNI